MTTPPRRPRIEALTPEQETQMIATANTWKEIAFSTAPADRPRAEAGVRRIYEGAGLLAPEIVWVASPLAIAQQWLAAVERWEADPSEAAKRATVSVRGNVHRRAPAAVGDLERASVDERIRKQVRDVVYEPLWDIVRDVRDGLWAHVVTALAGQGAPQHIAKLRYEVGDCYRDPESGQFDAHWLGSADFYGSVCGLPGFLEATAGLSDIARSAGWCSPQVSVCWLSERPEIFQREAGRAVGAPETCSLVYPDGFSARVVFDEPG